MVPTTQTQSAKTWPEALRVLGLAEGPAGTRQTYLPPRVANQFGGGIRDVVVVVVVVCVCVWGGGVVGEGGGELLRQRGVKERPVHTLLPRSTQPPACGCWGRGVGEWGGGGGGAPVPSLVVVESSAGHVRRHCVCVCVKQPCTASVLTHPCPRVTLITPRPPSTCTTGTDGDR